MSQTSITSFFNSRKRAAPDDLSCKYKILHNEGILESNRCTRKIQLKNCVASSNIKESIVSASKIKPGEVERHEIVTTSASTIAKVDPLEICHQVFPKKSKEADEAKTSEPSKSEGIASAPKELSLRDIRKRLAGSSRLAELKAAADRLSQGIQQLKEASDKKNLKVLKSNDLEVLSSLSKRPQLQNEFLTPSKHAISAWRPLSSPREVITSPAKSPNKKSSYIRPAALVATSTSLPLPHHYRFLSELFRGMETVVALLYNRNEKITFAKLKPSVQEMLKRNFTEKHLAQIKYLVPDFYNFEVQKIKNFSASTHKETYEMVITPNFPNAIKVMNSSVLLERRRYFYDALLKLVKKLHSQYLLTLNQPMVIPDEKLSRWHPEFDIENLPEIVSAKLPEMPNVEKFSSAQDVLSKARELFKCNTKMERALEKLAQAKARGLTEAEKVATGIRENVPTTPINSSQTSQPSTSNVPILNPALRNLPASLLEKVKAKQAAKALEAMTRSSDHEHKYVIYNRLPDLARTLRNIFVTERKNVLALNIILSKLESSFKANISANDIQRDIKALSEEVPELVQLHEIKNNTYLKLDKNADLYKITRKLNVLAAKYRND